MKLTEVMNLSAADLKAKRQAIVNDLAAGDQKDLPDRFVQALTDAKTRDEKLAEQGKTITTLNDACDGLKTKVAELEKRLAKAEADLKAAVAANATLNAKGQEEKTRADAAEKLAKDRRTILAKIVNDITPLLAAE